MSDAPYFHNLPVAAYRAALLAELNTPPMDKEHKAAIIAELERIGSRTADEDRSGVQAAAGGNTVGRAPAAAPIQAPNPATPGVAPAGRHLDGDDSGR